MYKYTLFVQWSKEDNCYIVSVPDLPGCVADGETPEEAAKNAQIVIGEWIETAKALGREIPEPTYVNVM
jgi:predicted RNase H-like HicB family nuclease